MDEFPKEISGRYKQAYLVYMDWVNDPNQSQEELAKKHSFHPDTVSRQISRGLAKKWHTLTVVH